MVRRSLHDIVRDYVIGLHSPSELKEGHRRVVEYFRRFRPTDAHGRPRWDPSLAKQDKVTAYVCENAEYHIKSG